MEILEINKRRLYFKEMHIIIGIGLENKMGGAYEYIRIYSFDA